jgi:hypothetical protein
MASRRDVLEALGGRRGFLDLVGLALERVGLVGEVEVAEVPHRAAYQPHRLSGTHQELAVTAARLVRGVVQRSHQSLKRLMSELGGTVWHSRKDTRRPAD